MTAGVSSWPHGGEAVLHNLEKDPNHFPLARHPQASLRAEPKQDAFSRSTVIRPPRPGINSSILIEPHPAQEAREGRPGALDGLQKWHLQPLEVPWRSYAYVLQCR